MVKIENLVKRYGSLLALDHFNIEVKEGEIFGLLGPNGSGKTTAINCILSLLKFDRGSIRIMGEEMTPDNYRVKREIGIVMQDVAVFEELNVWDNIDCFCGLYVKDKKKRRELVEEAIRFVGLEDYRKSYPKKLSGGLLRRLNIACGIAHKPKLIIMDEPTTSLTDPEIERVFDMMRMLKSQGISLIYISHKMDEIFEICDEISVLRDGNLVMTKAAKDTNMNELITAMVGRSLESRFPPVDNTPGDTIFSVQHLSTKYAPHLQDISFDVREGEIFGLYGLVGAGRTELLETIFGVRTRAAGRVYFKNRLMNFNNAKEAIEHGFALITEERKANGLFLKCDLTFNTTIASLEQYKTGLALSDAKMVKATNKEIKIMHTKCMGPDDMITSLSGGNQQKVIFGKWLEREPQVFMMDEPTRGIDVGAKYEIYELIIQMAKQGKTIIVVSSEMPEILGITNRIGVMSNGRLSGIVNTKETDQEELLRLSAKYL